MRGRGIRVLIVVVCCFWSAQLALAQPVERDGLTLQKRWAKGAMEDYLAPLLSRRADGSGRVKVLRCNGHRCLVRVTGTVRCRVLVGFRPAKDDPSVADVWVERLRCR